MTPKEQIARARAREREAVQTARRYIARGDYGPATVWLVAAAECRGIRESVVTTDAWHKARPSMRQSKAGES